jgi:L-alanine-DL-glutamate epimerase-like enolase superfamily enzyme
VEHALRRCVTVSASSAFLRVRTDDGLCGPGEASPMQGGIASLDILTRDIAPAVIGADPLDHAVIQDKLLHRLVKLGPEGALSGALAALDIALWDLKGKYSNQPIYKLLGGAWRTALPFYSSIGGNGTRSLDEVLRVVEQRLSDKPAAIKIRFDNDRSTFDFDIAGDLAKARAVRKLVGPEFPLAFDANNGFSLNAARSRARGRAAGQRRRAHPARSGQGDSRRASRPTGNPGRFHGEKQRLRRSPCRADCNCSPSRVGADHAGGCGGGDVAADRFNDLISDRPSEGRQQ